MPPLPTDLRSSLEKAVLAARQEAEAAARASLRSFTVQDNSPSASLTPEGRVLRNALRARARQLGGGRLDDDSVDSLAEEVAYQQWHRMLFARFLAENNLLIHPSGVPVTLQDCEELAAEEGEADAWQLAARYASLMLPGIFRADDPTSQVRLSPEGRNSLESILTRLPKAVFTADDSLGWVYQFWQSRRKDAVNKSGRKIGGADLAPVTQLFTEHYMVQFLLENSLGAWWAARHPDSPLLKTFTYLRYLDGTPAAGTFPGWPDRTAAVTVMDPCCGSGHFLVSAFDMLRRMRMEEEGLGEAEAADAVLRDNLFGLEIDPRCIQIAAFALAFAAWKSGGYRQLPLPNIACSGIPVTGQLETWTKLAGDDVNLQETIKRLYHLFRNAPDLGSLINPADVPVRDRMFTPDYSVVEPLLHKALAKERNTDDPVAIVFGAAAEGVARAASLLSRQYTLVVTNVPYLSSSREDDTLRSFTADHYPDAKISLATVFLERSRRFCEHGGTYSLVTPQNWQFLGSYTALRRKLLNEDSWNLVAILGAKAFSTPMWDFGVALTTITVEYPTSSRTLFGFDATRAKTATEKDLMIRTAQAQRIGQAEQHRNPDARITLTESQELELLSKYAIAPQGIKTGDDDRWRRVFWELPVILAGWECYQSTVANTLPYGGREHIIDWSLQGIGMPCRRPLNEAVGRTGVAISQMSNLPATLYTGERYDSNVGPIVPRNPAHLPALWAFCSSTEFSTSIRRIDQKLNVTNATLVKVPFDLDHWQKVAEEAGPLPEPNSTDPTQWLFKGEIMDSTEPLQVAVARLLDYSWPQQEPNKLDRLADADGIVALSPIGDERPAAERLRGLLASAYSSDWSPAVQDRLLAGVDYAGKSLEEWLRDGFFLQHCKLFHNRPFIWHIWDGRKDGFSALVNYHKLDQSLLNTLIYKYLGRWITLLRDAIAQNIAGADGRLVAALELHKKLEAIRDGEPPYDIYVRWKPLHKQPIGWNPDLNNGVRLNIRPFVEAGVLRSKFTINWNKDRGTNPDGSERRNDKHLTIAEKQAARRAAGV